MKSKTISLLLAFSMATIFSLASLAKELKNFPSTDFTVVDYALNQQYSIVDMSFRGTWVVSPGSEKKLMEDTKRLQKKFNALSSIRIGAKPRDVKKSLGTPIEKRSNGRIWIYGEKDEEGNVENLKEVFFDSKIQKVISVISFDNNFVSNEIGINVNDSIEKVIDRFGEPVNENDFIEDPDNSHYLGMYYLYPRSGIGFLIGESESGKELLVQGVIVFGKS